MESKRILELALENLEKQRTDLVAAIEQIQSLNGRNRRGIGRRPETQMLAVARRRSRTSAERKAQSERMKAYWAAKRAAKAKKASPGSGKSKARTAKSKAVSEGMRAYWKRRKEEEAKKASPRT